MIDVLDSHYNYVKTRVQSLVNPTRKFMGATMAQDWPNETVQMESFYMLDLGQVPIGRQSYSASVPILSYTVQWTWLIAGTDIQNGVKGRNRAERYRTNYDMKNELRIALFPNFCEKLQFSLSGETVIKTSYDPQEYITWTPSTFRDRIDKPSGLVYGLCTVQITGMTGNIAA